ncbi:MAG: hypothetical protein EXR81_03115 [Gammaproteobacteria bacterium]|nr:hypothetical protein [Gammaproteobacteria bacterium]
MNQISDILYWDELLTKIDSEIKDQKKREEELPETASFNSASSGIASSADNLNGSPAMNSLSIPPFVQMRQRSLSI